MYLDQESIEALKPWLASKLEIEYKCEADPSALAKYVIALVNQKKPNEKELKHDCIDQLEVFLQSRTEDFVEQVFKALHNKEYFPVQQGNLAMLQCDSAVVQQKDQKSDNGVEKMMNDINSNQMLETNETVDSMSDKSREVSPKGSREPSPLPSCITDLDENQICQICEGKLSQPKILDCLHVFCQSCLEKTYQEQCEEDSKNVAIVCPVCKQETKMPEKGVEGLVTEYVLSDMLEIAAIDEIICTSCKAKEKAVARCTDCASYLCANCVTAHQFMRCFDNHKVVNFEDLKNGGGDVALHKFVFCNVHPTEILNTFCITCQLPICSDCMLGDHKKPIHDYERISDVGESQKEELKSLIENSKEKVTSCNEVHQTLESSLGELEMQRDNAKGLIQETFQSYKAILEKRKNDLLQELEEYHSRQELAIMDLFQQVGKTSEKLEDGIKYTEMVLDKGSPLHVVLGKNMIFTQLLSLIGSIPKPDININIEFNTNSDVFKEAVSRTFGSFSKEEPKMEQPLSSLHSSFENEGFNLASGVISPTNSILPPMAAPNYQHFRTITPVSISSNIQPPIGTMSTPAAGVTQPLQEATCLSRNSHSPAMSDSGISVDNASNNSGSCASMSMNVAALAKLGFPHQGLPPSSAGVVGPSSIGSVDASLPGQINPPIARSQSIAIGDTTELENLTRMLQVQQPSTNLLGDMGSSVGSVGSMSSIGTINQIPAFSMSITGGGCSTGNYSSPALGQCPPVRRGNKMSAMQIRCKFGQLGPGKGQFNSPHGFCLGVDEDIIVADTNNHRVQVFEKSGEYKYQFGIPGREEGQLWYPRKVVVMRSTGKYVVCDRGNERSRMQIFTKNGNFVKKIAIRYIDIVAGLAITSAGHIVAVDSVSPTVFCIAESGELLKWFDCSDYMREPSDIAISGKEYFVCDFKGHCVVVFNEDGQFMRRIGCENITNYPNGIDISDAGDVLIGDSHGNRFHVAVFQRDGSLIGEFECPYVKVSRCCGLKITSEGYVVTLAKNNHHVLVLNTLYIT